MAEGVYTCYLRVTGSNHATRDIGLYVTVTQSGVGNVVFKVSDIYTATLDSNDNLIQGLSGAKIRIYKEQVFTEDYKEITDSIGQAEFNDLSAGRWKFRIRAGNHQEQTGRFWIKPGVTTNQEVFLHYNLVTVEWEVTETTIEDKYDIVLNATYETSVPAAVLVAEPASATLPDMNAGDVFNGEFTLTNHGLIRADDLAVTPPPDNARFRYDILGGLPDSISPNQRITVPYRVTCLQSPAGGEDATGGGCKTGADRFITRAIYECRAGVKEQVGVEYILIKGVRECDSGTPWILVDEEKDRISDTDLQFDVPDYTPGPPTNKGDPIPGGDDDCLPCPDDPDCPHNDDRDDDKTQKVGCSVNTLYRQFHDDVIDVSIKVKGGMVTAKRFFNGDVWGSEFDLSKIKIEEDQITMPRDTRYTSGAPSSLNQCEGWIKIIDNGDGGEDDTEEGDTEEDDEEEGDEPAATMFVKQKFNNCSPPPCPRLISGAFGFPGFDSS
ncbi:MAG: hypothetical protein GY835_03445, partial [bacterium]|nr:hypothetical protein [bacterium]